MKVLHLLAVVLGSHTGAIPAVGEDLDSMNAEVRSAVTERRLAEAVRLFEDLAHPTATDRYLTGFALMELHEPQRADALLRASKEGGFEGWSGWPDVDVLLDRVRKLHSLTPPPKTPSLPGLDSTIALHMESATSWSGAVVDALPEFAAVGRSIFGKDVPPLRLYLFVERKQYERFYEALFGMQIPTAWQDGTGNLNVVVYCETDRQGRMTREAGAPETIGCVLHEFGHAWASTYLMYRHGKEWLSPALRRPWFDEGLADFIASLREPAYLLRRAEWLKEAAAKGAPAPTFKRIQDYDGFYQKDNVDVHYWASALFVADLLGGGRAPETIRRTLDAVGRSGSVQDAVSSVTGKELSKEFERVIERFWRMN